jgi:hypothetical protein
LQKRAYILPHDILDVEPFGPSNQFTLVDADLLHGETKRKPQPKDMFIPVTFGRGHRLSPADVLLKVVFVVHLEEGLDLLGQEGEELAAGLGHHELSRNGDFGLREGEGRVAVQLDGANAEIGATEIDGEVKALQRYW